MDRRTLKTGMLLTRCLGVALAMSLPALPASAADFTIKHFMVGLSVADIDAMTAWYRDNLGFKVIADAAMGPGGSKVRLIEAGNERIELVWVPNSKPGIARTMPPGHAINHGYAQLTMEVPDLEAARASLAAKGIKPGLDITPVEALGMRIMFMTDPEGNLVELVERMKKP